MGNLVFQATLGGQVNLVGPNTASTFNINVPALSGTMASIASVNNNGVIYVNSSGQPTTGTALVFDGTNLGVGQAPSAWSIGKNIDFGTTGAIDSDGYTRLVDNAYYNAAWKTKVTGQSSYYQMGVGVHSWFTAPSVTAGSTATFTQAMTLDASGNLVVGATAGSWGSASGNQVSPSFQQINKYNGSSGDQFVAFSRNSTTIGSITQNGTTGVLYNLTSDYRLKNNSESLTGAKKFVMALQPKKWQWWDGSGEGVGFIAHEFMEVAKYSGQGEKDAVDENGNPVYQSIQPSSSEVMANLVAHIQELEARLAALESK